MHLSQVVFISLLGFAAAAPAPDGLDSSSAVVVDDFKPDWNTFDNDFKKALEESKTDASLAKRLNTHSASNVGYGQAIYAAGAAAVNQVKGLKNWDKVLKKCSLCSPSALLLLLLPLYDGKLTISTSPGSSTPS